MVTLAENRRAYFDYEILEKFEAGIELLGHEVKSVKGKQASLEGAHIIVRGGEAYLVGARVPPYQPKNAPVDYDPCRARKLLLTKKEIETLARAESANRLTIVPISMYNKNSKIKLLFGISKGKKKSDKRETIKRREAEREIRRTLKRE